ncbi:glycosyltransferase family 9 protein [Cellulomonas marina]|uniref:ADP-heptose:LPS heptosyltransferase n=1 Tax=Cellulomonas marina TaxID=988821 RepID=A0A1I0V751_9CELL|nr:glycosyltransferase family 9 protein [Cellulomonas marina]GIG28367.1 glycosyl transferase [Cellulomonas marina]SFA71913.1 ADP-heptose:LPS heptosyltransferase [Cellulomonas marina]
MTGDVLVLRALGLGDALTGVAALRGLRRAFPGRRLVLAAPATTGGWLRDLGLVDAVLPTRELEPFAWSGTGHVAVNLHGRGPQSHALLAATRPDRLVAFAAPGFPGGPAFDPEEHEVVRWCRLVAAAGGTCGPQDLRLPEVTSAPAPAPEDARPEVLLHPGAASGARRWPADRFAAVGVALRARGFRVGVTGGPDERELCAQVVAGVRERGGTAGGGTGDAGDEARDVVDLAGALDLPALAARVAGAALLVCGDTGVAHLATAVATPSVVLFGPVPPRWWRPLLDERRHAVVWHGDDGSPAGDGGADVVHPWLASVQVPEVLDAVDRVLGAGRAPARPRPSAARSTSTAVAPRPSRTARTVGTATPAGPARAVSRASHVASVASRPDG